MRERLAIKNGAITLCCQLLDVILGFVVRKIFITYIGVAMLGLNGTFTSLLNTLSLAELGFESAVIYSLYKPLQENDTNTVEEFVAILKKTYEVVGLFIVFAGIILSFFLPSILKGIDVNATVYVAFYLQLAGSAVTYFMAYKKTFLLAQQKDYIRNIYSSLFKTAATILQIILIILCKNYLFYVAISVVQNFLTNYAMSRYVDRHYDYNFKRNKINKGLLHELIADVKDIFFGKIAGYVYSSTDNIVISTFVSTLSVGLLGNYTQILYQIKTVVNNVFNSTKPIIGHFLNAEKSKDHAFEVLMNYTFVRYMACVMLFIPGFVLCDCFIFAWLGQEYVLEKEISLLLVTDIFIHFVHGALVDYIAGLGYFKADRNISIIGAIMNITISVALVNVIGIAGVLVGTVISQFFFWVSRSWIVTHDFFDDVQRRLRDYWIKCIIYTLVFYALCFICRMLFDAIPLADSYIKFIVGGVMCYAIILPTIFLLFGRSKQFAFLMDTVKKYLNRKKVKA